MNKRYYYSAGNHYASETDIGFCNTWYVMAFSSRRARDDYVRKATDMATCAITKSEIKTYITAPKPFSGLHLAIVNDVPWEKDKQPEGYLGDVQKSDEGGGFGYVRRLWS